MKPKCFLPLYLLMWTISLNSKHILTGNGKVRLGFKTVSLRVGPKQHFGINYTLTCSHLQPITHTRKKKKIQAFMVPKSNLMTFTTWGNFNKKALSPTIAIYSLWSICLDNYILHGSSVVPCSLIDKLKLS